MNRRPHLLKFYLRIISKNLDRETLNKLGFGPPHRSQVEPYRAEILEIDFDEVTGEPYFPNDQRLLLGQVDPSHVTAPKNMDLFKGPTILIPYEPPEGKKLYSQEGLELCVRLNKPEIQRVRQAHQRLTNALRPTPSSAALANLSMYYERVRGDYRAWLDAKGLGEPEGAPVQLPPLSGWQDLTIIFISDDLVEIRMQGQYSREFTSKSLGFEDRRNLQPNEQWELMKKLAALDGELPYGNQLLNFEKRKDTEQRISRIRKQLKQDFGLQDDPIPWIRTRNQTGQLLFKGYRCVFTLKMVDQFRSEYQQ